MLSHSLAISGHLFFGGAWCELFPVVHAADAWVMITQYTRRHANRARVGTLWTDMQ